MQNHPNPIQTLHDEALCPICLDYFTEPVSIGCGHNFCRACVTRLWGPEDEIQPRPRVAAQGNTVRRLVIWPNNGHNLVPHWYDPWRSHEQWHGHGHGPRPGHEHWRGNGYTHGQWHGHERWYGNHPGQWHGHEHGHAHEHGHWYRYGHGPRYENGLGHRYGHWQVHVQYDQHRVGNGRGRNWGYMDPVRLQEEDRNNFRGRLANGQRAQLFPERRMERGGHRHEQEWWNQRYPDNWVRYPPLLPPWPPYLPPPPPPPRPPPRPPPPPPPPPPPRRFTCPQCRQNFTQRSFRPNFQLANMVPAIRQICSNPYLWD